MPRTSTRKRSTARPFIRWHAPYMPHEIDAHPDGARIQATIDAAVADATEDYVEKEEYEFLEKTNSDLEDEIEDLRLELEALREKADA